MWLYEVVSLLLCTWEAEVYISEIYSTWSFKRNNCHLGGGDTFSCRTNICINVLYYLGWQPETQSKWLLQQKKQKKNKRKLSIKGISWKSSFVPSSCQGGSCCVTRPGLESVFCVIGIILDLNCNQRKGRFSHFYPWKFSAVIDQSLYRKTCFWHFMLCKLLLGLYLINKGFCHLGSIWIKEFKDDDQKKQGF